MHRFTEMANNNFYKNLPVAVFTEIKGNVYVLSQTSLGLNEGCGHIVYSADAASKG